MNIAGHWAEANQRYLMASVAVVRQALAGHAARGTEGSIAGKPADELEKAVQEARQALPAPAAIDLLCATFGLSRFERDTLLLCAGMELDSSFAELCASAQGSAQRPFPTFSLALAALPEAHWSALCPTGPLRHWRLIEVSAGETLTNSALRIDERVLHFLAGVPHAEVRLQGVIKAVPVSRPNDLPESQRETARRIRALWSPRPVSGVWPVVQLCGPARVGKAAVASQACAEAGLELYRMSAADVPSSAADREILARLWEREAGLCGSALLIDGVEPENSRTALAFLENVKGIVLVASEETLEGTQRVLARVEVPAATPAEQCEWWRRSLGEAAAQLNGQIETLVSQFTLEPGMVRAVSAQVLAPVDANQAQELGARLWDACRGQSRQKLDDLSERIEPMAHWDDLVLPEFQKETLRQIAVHVRNRARVLGEWGFAGKGRRGLGISALFAGASGTGKTMAAEVLANELRLDLYRIDLSQVVSKYIGETEKNLRRVFDLAEVSGAILLFDEADALFGKRSEVKDSHDRYANIEISYLLQRMEAYRGLAILTSNMRSALDSAFLRRLRFVVEFPFPDAGQRAEIWRRSFPASTPTHGLSIERLARLNVAGGVIRNIALQAAFLAADTDETVGMAHLLRAARSEYAKMEKTLTEAETARWL